MEEVSLPREFLSTLPARGATSCGPALTTTHSISIHAPREGSDKVLSDNPGLVNISIHAPREGSDEYPNHKHLAKSQFLSTLPARGATKRLSEAD